MKRNFLLGIAMLAVASTFAFANGAQETGGAAEPSSNGEVVVNVALANSPLSQALDKLAKKYYHKDGVQINIAVLPENDLRQKMLTEASTGGSTYDIFYIGPYEGATWLKYGWLEDLEPYFAKMTPEQTKWYDRADRFKGMDASVSYKGDQYAIPYYGESSFIMYNKELFAEKGLTMPEAPTWDQIYDLAKKINDPSKGIVGMTMRGAPGWGMSGAVFIPIVNAYGGRFYDMNWNATVDTPEQRAAWKMYKDILRDAGQEDILSYTYNECIALMSSGKCGIYYDATSLAPPLEAKDSKVACKVGYVLPPHEKLKSNNGFIWNWSMAINPHVSQAKKDAAFDFMLWATSKDFVQLTLKEDPTGSMTPAATRNSTYEDPIYSKIPYAPMTLKTLSLADFNHPCYDPVPYIGIQYIAIPEFADAGTKMTQYLADYVVDKITLDEAISKTQKLFEQVAIDGGYKK